MLSGTVKVWNKDKGWGFISGDNGEDYFANVSDVRSGQTLRIGVRVKFDTSETQRGTIAENITLS